MATTSNYGNVPMTRAGEASKKWRQQAGKATGNEGGTGTACIPVLFCSRYTKADNRHILT